MIDHHKQMKLETMAMNALKECMEGRRERKQWGRTLQVTGSATK
jgi:hypothetical protein